ncbi:uncharacterized protein LOC112591352 isoform X2 [Melanaphis sacchari]|uniref:uncharacterized protein LOC112591352 isoform X2 n=1 Tax=Melanaphis sacchari TaxID=742174 RepID=UPI000DC14839|nr:uncharacterized protein LOC112591352 isoform X2 [Melanaphis sacchari]
MGCVQSLFNSSKTRSPSPEKGFEMPTFETMPVTQQPQKSYNTGISVADDRVHSDIEDDNMDYEDEDDDIAFRCDDFDRYAMEIDGDLHSVHFEKATACTELVSNSGTVAIPRTTAKCKSADASPANKRQRPQLVGSLSQPQLESRFVKATAVRKLAAETGTIAVLSSTTEPEPEPMYVWTEKAHYSDRLAARSGGPVAALSLDAGPPPPTPSPFSSSSTEWPVAGDSRKSDLDRIPVGVIEVLDCEPADQCRPTPPKAQRYPKSQRVASRNQNIPLPVIHAMEMKPNALGHDELFKTVTVQPPSSDRHGYRPRMTTGSSTFDSSCRKPFIRQSNKTKEYKFTEDDYAAVTGWMATMPVFAKCPPAKSKSLPSRDAIPPSTSTAEGTGDRQHGVLRGSSLPYDNGSAENSSKPIKRDNDKIAIMVPISVESTTVVPEVIHKSDELKKLVLNDKPDGNHEMDIIVKSDTNVESDMNEKPNEKYISDDTKAPGDNVESVVKVEKELDQKNEHHVGEVCTSQEDGDVDKINSNDSKYQVSELDTEYRLTMIHSVREAVNRICEQAVEKTAAIVRNRNIKKRNSNSSLISSLKDRDADNSETADYASSDFSLPPPPPLQQHSLDTGSTGQESSWPPPPTLSEAEEERTIAPAGYSFDLPDPPTEMDQMDSETDKLDISDEEMRATGLPSDDDDKTDTEAGDGGVENDLPGNEIVVMKSTASGGGSSDGSMEATVVVPQDNGADDRAATTIQAVYRGFRARKYVEAVNAAAVKIQAGFRGYRVRQSLKNAAPSTATTATDDSQCWSDDDQKSVVSVIYTPLKEYGCEPRGAGDGRGDGDDESTSGIGGEDSVSGVVADGDVVSGGNGNGDGVGDDHSVVVGSIGDGHVVDAGVGVSGAIGVYVDDDDDDDQLQSGDDEVFERDDKDNISYGSGGVGGGDIGLPATIPTTTLTEPTNSTKVSAVDDVAEAEALVQAAVKIQARVRGFATRKRLNEEKNDGTDKQQ